MKNGNFSLLFATSQTFTLFSFNHHVSVDRIILVIHLESAKRFASWYAKAEDIVSPDFTLVILYPT